LGQANTDLGRQRLVGAVGCSRSAMTQLDLSGELLRTAASKVDRAFPSHVLLHFVLGRRNLGCRRQSLADRHLQTLAP